jgi:hypothetical protein
MPRTYGLGTSVFPSVLIQATNACYEYARFRFLNETTTGHAWSYSSRRFFFCLLLVASRTVLTLLEYFYAVHW